MLDLHIRRATKHCLFNAVGHWSRWVSQILEGRRWLGQPKKAARFGVPISKNALESCSRGLKQDHRHRTATEIKSVGKGCFHRLFRPINPLLGHDLGSPVWLRSENNLFKPLDPTNWLYSAGLLYSFFPLVLYHDTSARTLSGFYHYQPIQIDLLTFAFGMGKPRFLSTWWLLALYRKPVFFFFRGGVAQTVNWHVFEMPMVVQVIRKRACATMISLYRLTARSISSYPPACFFYLSFCSASDFFMFRCGWELPSWACTSAVNGWVCTCVSMHPLSAFFSSYVVSFRSIRSHPLLTIA